MTPFNPDSWMDFLLLVLIALIGLAGTTLPVVISRRQNKTMDKHGKTLDNIEDQVVNDHEETNLRDDIDKLTALVASGFSETRKDIAGLREEMRTERVERIEGDRRGMRRLGLTTEDDER